MPVVAAAAAAAAVPPIKAVARATCGISRNFFAGADVSEFEFKDLGEWGENLKWIQKNSDHRKRFNPPERHARVRRLCSALVHERGVRLS